MTTSKITPERFFYFLLWRSLQLNFASSNFHLLAYFDNFVFFNEYKTIFESEKTEATQNNFEKDY